MTTERVTVRGGVAKLLKRGAILLAIVAGWVGVLAVATAALGPVGSTVLVLGPHVPPRLPEGAGILRAGTGRTVVTAPDAASVRNLYAHGAWLVLPALRNGCMDLRPA
ncbi:hypothetical protein [Rhizobium sp. AG855]|uniref:hypothetical protein n=1 Tax=Rhizobium sp. AG855 TaxID=2183898 RepID=UPI000FF50E90|nr:hypothetical protein [Rhizobium sp. AG855]RKE85265.1 hypothetical protein DFO46_2061 [Rhizobium sp. AG855]